MNADILCASFLLLKPDNNVLIQTGWQSIILLRTAVDEDGDGVLDKESTSYNDIFDAFRLALKLSFLR